MQYRPRHRKLQSRLPTAFVSVALRTAMCLVMMIMLLVVAIIAPVADAQAETMQCRDGNYSWSNCDVLGDSCRAHLIVRSL